MVKNCKASISERVFCAASFLSDIVDDGIPAGRMPGTPAIVVSPGTDETSVLNRVRALKSPNCTANARLGRIVLISPHVEDGEPASKNLLRSLLRWAAKLPSTTRMSSLQALRQRGSWLHDYSPFYPESECSKDLQSCQVSKLRMEAMHYAR